MFDVLAMLQLLKRPTSVVLKKELENIPFLKQVIACLGALPIDRRDPAAGHESYLAGDKGSDGGKKFHHFRRGDQK